LNFFEKKYKFFVLRIGGDLDAIAISASSHQFFPFGLRHSPGIEIFGEKGCIA